MTYIDKEGEWRNKRVTVFEAVGSLIQQLKDTPDITRVSMPSVFCHPYSLTELEGFRCLRKIDLLLEAKKEKDPVERILKISYWVLSIIHSPLFQKKPYNPVLGETLGMWVQEENNKDNKTVFFAEQVSHHPPIMCSALENEEEGIRGEFYVNFGAKFHGNSASIESVGKRTLLFYDPPQKDQKQNPNKNQEEENKEDFNEKLKNNNDENGLFRKLSFDSFFVPKKGEEVNSKEEKTEEPSNNNNNSTSSSSTSSSSTSSSKTHLFQNNQEKKREIEEKDGEKYYISNFIPNLWMKNILLGTRRHNWEGRIEIKCPKTNLVCVIEWKEEQSGSFFNTSYSNAVHVRLYSFPDSSLFSSAPHTNLPNSALTSGVLLKEMKGEAGEDMFFFEKGKKGDLAFSPSKHIERTPSVLDTQFRNPSSSLQVWGKLSDSIVDHNLKLADQSKREVEQKQRELRKQREINKSPFIPSFFHHNNDNWFYNFPSVFIPYRYDQEQHQTTVVQEEN